VGNSTWKVLATVIRHPAATVAYLRGHDRKELNGILRTEARNAAKVIVGAAGTVALANPLLAAHGPVEQTAVLGASAVTGQLLGSFLPQTPKSRPKRLLLGITGLGELAGSCWLASKGAWGPDVSALGALVGSTTLANAIRGKQDLNKAEDQALDDAVDHDEAVDAQQHQEGEPEESASSQQKKG
jgi:hypothetical protein